MRRGTLWGLGLLGALGVLLAARGILPAWELAVWAIVLIGAILLEKGRYAPIPKSGEALQETEEKFIDPVSGKVVVVWLNPETGERFHIPRP
ncbi:MAG: hypothetical protein M0T84_17445 [Betaproteobacteria bacterium]|nr:hypothetical protein [Betaproteobacteria bacterium]